MSRARRLGWLLVASGLMAARPAGAEEVGPGVLHPDLRLPTIDGARTISLASLRGRRVLLIEFASW